MFFSFALSMKIIHKHEIIFSIYAVITYSYTFSFFHKAIARNEMAFTVVVFTFTTSHFERFIHSMRPN